MFSSLKNGFESYLAGLLTSLFIIVNDLQFGNHNRCYVHFINGRTLYKPDMIRNYNKHSESIHHFAVQNEFYVDDFSSYLDTGFIIVWEVLYD